MRFPGCILALAALAFGCAAPPPGPASAKPSAQPAAESPKPLAPPKVAEAPKPAAPPKAVEAPKPAAPPKAVEAPKPAAPPKTGIPQKVPAPAAAPPTLDLQALERRLKDTDAIGVLTKLSLKNQVDDLVERFRAFHAGQRPPTLGELRPAFDLLLMKVLSLLQDKDGRLARDIDASRDAIWGVLADRDKFSRST
jgi:hypothetical protein